MAASCEFPRGAHATPWWTPWASQHVWQPIDQHHSPADPLDLHPGLLQSKVPTSRQGRGESTHENELGNFPSSWLEMILLSCYQDLSGMHRSPKFLERQQPGNFRVFQSHSAAAPGNFSPSLGEKPPEYQASTGRKSPNSMEIYGSANHRTIAGSTSKPCLSTKRQPGNGKAASSGKVTCYLKLNIFMFFVKWAGFISGSHKQMGQNQFLVSFKNRPAMMDSIKSLYTCVHVLKKINIYICIYICIILYLYLHNMQHACTRYPETN